MAERHLGELEARWDAAVHQTHDSRVAARHQLARVVEQIGAAERAGSLGPERGALLARLRRTLREELELARAAGERDESDATAAQDQLIEACLVALAGFAAAATAALVELERTRHHRGPVPSALAAQVASAVRQAFGDISEPCTSGPRGTPPGLEAVLAPELLAERIAAHARFLAGEATGTRLELADVSLRGADLRGAPLSEARFERVDLRGARLGDAHLAGAVLEDVWLGGAQLGAADLREVRLERVDLRGAVLAGVVLTNARLIDVDARAAVLGGALLRKARLQRCELGGAVLTGANLYRADLAHVGLTGCELDEVDLTAVSGEEVDLRFARVAGARWFQAQLAGVKVAGLRGFHADGDDLRLSLIDRSPRGDGSAPCEAADLVDPIEGRPLAMHLRIDPMSPEGLVFRAEPGARPRSLALAELVLPGELVAALEAWSRRCVGFYDVTLSGHSDGEALDDEGRALVERILRASLAAGRPIAQVSYVRVRDGAAEAIDLGAVLAGEPAPGRPS